MKIIAETPRLILRHFIDEDAKGLFELDSNPNVLTYLNTPPITNMADIHAMLKRIRGEYATYGVGRVAVVLKETNEMIGWAGLKYMRTQVGDQNNFYDVGYRFIERFWGKGYATEAAHASLAYGFNDLKLDVIYAMAMLDHKASRNILEKIGMQYIKVVDFDKHPHAWYECKRPI